MSSSRKRSPRRQPSAGLELVHIPLSARVRVSDGVVSAEYDYGTIPAEKLASFLMRSFGIDPEDLVA